MNLCRLNLNLDFAGLLNSDAYGGKLRTCLFWHLKIAIASNLLFYSSSINSSTLSPTCLIIARKVPLSNS